MIYSMYSYKYILKYKKITILVYVYKLNINIVVRIARNNIRFLFTCIYRFVFTIHLHFQYNCIYLQNKSDTENNFINLFIWRILFKNPSYVIIYKYLYNLFIYLLCIFYYFFFTIRIRFINIIYLFIYKSLMNGSKKFLKFIFKNSRSFDTPYVC